MVTVCGLLIIFRINLALAERGQKYSVITDDRAIYYTIKTNNRNQDKDMGKANEDGLINCTG